MIIKEFKPIANHDSYTEEIQKHFEYNLYDLIYRPLLEILGNIKRKNAKSSLLQAIESGKIAYRDTAFYGKFNAEISRELRKLGASFDKRTKAFKIPLSKLTYEVRTAIISGNNKLLKEVSDLFHSLDESSEGLIYIDFSRVISDTVKDLNIQSKKTMPEDLHIPLEIDSKMSKELMKDYKANLNLYIQGLKEDAIQRLRDSVTINISEGYRSDRMIERIQSEYGISVNRAKFIARQETSLFVSKYREQRYTEAGINQYKWSTSHDERVRDDHSDLNGKIFSWDSPPIVDKSTGRRAHPGEDFGCRCVAIPIMRSK